MEKDCVFNESNHVYDCSMWDMLSWRSFRNQGLHWLWLVLIQGRC